MRNPSPFRQRINSLTDPVQARITVIARCKAVVTTCVDKRSSMGRAFLRRSARATLVAIEHKQPTLI